jgi:hypothetical protein
MSRVAHASLQCPTAPQAGPLSKSIGLRPPSVVCQATTQWAATFPPYQAALSFPTMGHWVGQEFFQISPACAVHCDRRQFVFAHIPEVRVQPVIAFIIVAWPRASSHPLTRRANATHGHRHNALQTRNYDCAALIHRSNHGNFERICEFVNALACLRQAWPQFARGAWAIDCTWRQTAALRSTKQAYLKRTIEELTS